MRNDDFFNAASLTRNTMNFLHGPEMKTPITQLNIEHVAAAFHAIAKVEKAVKDRREELRLKLLDYAERNGTVTDKGGYEIEIAGLQVLRETRRDSTPSIDGLKELLKEANLPVSSAFDVIKVEQLNPTKLAALVEAGKLDEDKVEGLHKLTAALRVKPLRGD